MAVYVDRASVAFKGMQWCHLMADTLEELHAFAQNMKIDARLFHRNASYPHYDITLEMRSMVIEYGAIDADRKMIIAVGKRLKAQFSQDK